MIITIFATMAVSFYKYQGTGNDFVIIDNRRLNFAKNDVKTIAHLCDRKFGVGADGLILLENHNTLDFEMVYFNADGNQSTMCGNGGRCIVHFANFLGIIKDETEFLAIDGKHNASIKGGQVALQMSDVAEIQVNTEYSFLNTGSPHHVQMVENLSDYDVFSEGKRIRNDIYGNEGANVNFVERLSSNSFKVRTYERGVEDETLSCGTGVTAVAIAMFINGMNKVSQIKLETQGGKLEVSFEKNDGSFKNVFLKGPAVQVFKGQIEL
ncbi:MAG: diaminopimelate epimerase [Patiriisocius sp.]|jgi:diaminopimelate epimerase